jgi:hypothetical protein
LVEYSLHESIKEWYSKPGDKLEEIIGNYIIDVVRQQLLIEIQTNNFSNIKQKLKNLLQNNKVRLVYPIHIVKWIVRLDKSSMQSISRRKSPKKGRVEDVFSQLVYIPNLLSKENFSLEAVFIHSEEVLINDGKGSWRRKGWSIYDKRLVKIVRNRIFDTPEDLKELLPLNLPSNFTTRDLSKSLNLPVITSRRMAYCMRKMNLIKIIGKSRRTLIYSQV